MNESPEQPGRRPPPDYRVSDPAALDAEVKRQKELEAQREARAAEEQRKLEAAAEQPKPETEQERKERVERDLRIPERHREADKFHEQNIEARIQDSEERTARTTTPASGGSGRRTNKPPDKPPRKRKRSAAAEIAELEKALSSATTATAVLSALGRLLLARTRRPYVEKLVPTPAALHAVRGQLPSNVDEDIGTAAASVISFAVKEAPLGLYEKTIVQVHAQWKRNSGDAQQHPLEPLVAWWQEMQGSPPSKVPAVVLQYEGHDHLRTPGLMATAMLSPVIAVKVDGEPFGSTAPVQVMRRLSAPPIASAWEQLELLPGPRTLDDAAVDPVLATVSRIDCADRRSPLRSDVLMLVRLGCAILVPVELDIDGWARMLRGSPERVQREARLRAQNALTLGAVIVWQNHRPYQMVRAVTGLSGNVIVHPSAGAGWWQGGRGVGDAWRLSGGLWRRRWTGAKQGGHRRMAEGIEAALAWTPPGRAKSRISEALRPIDDQYGNPGHEYFIDWRRGLYLSGEPYPLDDDVESASRAYRKRVADFESAGYRAKGNDPAPAGDTWEITRRVKGGIFVRASARYIEAVRLSQHQQNFTHVTLDKLLAPGQVAA